MKTKPSDPAFPAQFTHPDYEPQFFGGLTVRQFFAAMAMAGMKASTPGCVHESVAVFAVQEADRLIEELNKERSGGDDKRNFAK